MFEKNNTVLFLILCLAVFGLFLLYKNNHLQISQQSKNVDNNSSTGATEALKSADYIFSRPNNGTLTFTEKITVEYIGNNQAVASLNDSAKVKIGQNVILHDKDMNVLPYPGKIQSIDAQSASTKKITISLPENTQTKHLSNLLEVITAEIRTMQRFPYSALQKDKNDNAYIWAIKKNDKNDKKQEITEKKSYSVKKIWLDKPIIGSRYFVAGAPVSPYDFVVLNPDEKLNETSEFKMAKIEFKAPKNSPIKHAYKTYKKLIRKKQAEETQRRIKNCGAGGQNLPESSQEGRACGEGKKEAMSPQEIFNSILSRQPTVSNASPKVK